jgi:Protein of unknown function (DUF1572)
MIENNYLECIKKQFLYYKSIGEKAIEQLEPQQLIQSDKDDSNSIAMIVKHLSGNMISRWTDFRTTDGEKETRNRDAEFENESLNKEQILNLWNKGWLCFFEALETVNAEQLSEIIYIRQEKHTIIEAINRQLAHYPYHIGQIVYIAKMLKTQEWNSLSIPKNKNIKN